MFGYCRKIYLLIKYFSQMGNMYNLLDVLERSVAVYFYELSVPSFKYKQPSININDNTLQNI